MGLLYFKDLHSHESAIAHSPTKLCHENPQNGSDGTPYHCHTSLLSGKCLSELWES